MNRYDNINLESNRFAWNGDCMKNAICLLVAVFMAAACSKNKGATLPPPPLPVILPGDLCPAPVPSVNTQVSQTSGEVNNPVIAPLDRGFYVAWRDWFGKYPTISGVKIDDAGLPVSEVNYFPNEGKCAAPAIAADADSTYISWIDGASARLVQLGKNNDKPLKFGETVKTAVAGPYGALVWEERGTLYFRNDGRLGLPDKNGNRPEPVPAVVATGGIESPALAWTGEFYAIVWSASIAGGRNIMMQRITNDGRRLGPAVKISGVGGHNNRPQIVWTGTEFAVAWTNAAPAEDNPEGNFRIFMAIVAKEGVRPLVTKQLEFNGSADVVSLATTGAELAMAWVGTKKPAGSAVYFRRLDMKGNLVGEQIRVSDDQPVAVGRPDISYIKGGYGVVWHDSRDFAGAEVYFSFLACSASEISTTAKDETDTAPDESQLKEVF